MSIAKGKSAGDRRGEDRRCETAPIDFADRRKDQRRKLADRRAKARTSLS